jgi:thiopeptide-type bacteriocin biosynthesis protein
LLPIEDLLRWSEELEAPACVDEPARLAAAVDADYARLRQRLAAIMERPEVREALFIASSDMVEALDAWRKNPTGRKSQRIEQSLVRYFSRMVARCTPFGLFAGCSVGSIATETRLEIGPLSTYRRHARLDMDYLVELSDSVVRDAALRDELLYRPNSSLYRLAGRLRYVECFALGRLRSYRLVGVEDSPHLQGVLQHAADGATLRELGEGLIDDEIDQEEATSYLQDLVTAQILVPDFSPAVTGREPIHDLLRQLRQHPVATPMLTRLEAAHQRLESLDAAPLGIDPDRYRSVAAELSDVPVPADDISRLLQIDLAKPAPMAALGQPVVDEIAQTVELLHGLRGSGDRFQSFRERFQERYEKQEVPLLEVLDEENGIGFDAGAVSDPSPLLDGLPFPGASAHQEGASWEPLDTFLLGRLIDVISSGAAELELKPEDLRARRSADRRPLPGAFGVSATLVAHSKEDIERGEFKLVFGGMSGPSGARMLGRFCHVDSALHAHVQAHTRDEEQADPGITYAEVVHLPEGRVGNVMLRPVLREYEIPYLGRSGAPVDKQIPVSDLTVSLEGDRIVLRSRRLGREVQPRLTNAHNFSRGLSVYRFLCALAQQHQAAGVFWSWGRLDVAPFLPRVRVGKVVVARARWRVVAGEIEGAASDDGSVNYRKVAEWRTERRLPRFVLLADGDNKLLFDLHNVLSAQTLLHYVRRRPAFTLEEFYPGPEELCATAPEGRFVHELIVPFVRHTEPERTAERSPRIETLARDRYFLPGSEWLYAKLYSGPATADRLLREIVSPLVREMTRANVIDQWFFIRYRDRQPHIRVRFHGAPSGLQEHLLPRLEELSRPLIDNGALAKLQFDTYQRETERYGGPAAILLAERFFCINSDAFLEVLELFNEDRDADPRWQIALLGMVQLLEDLGFGLEARLKFAEVQRNAHLRRERVDFVGFRRRLGDRFRRMRRVLEPLLDRGDGADTPLAAGRQILRRYSERFQAEVAGPLRALTNLTTPVENLAASYIHMHINRFVRADGVRHELVLYDFLSRLCESRIARAARQKTQA